MTRAADVVLGLGEPLQEIVHLDFQASAAAWKHADLLAYNALLYAQLHVPVHTILVLLRPVAAHGQQTGAIRYAPRPGRGSMDFGYEIVRLWERPAEELLAADVGVTPLAVLGRLPDDVSVEDGLGAVVRQVVDRWQRELSPDQVDRLFTDTYLLSGLRLRRRVAARVFGGIRAMHESDTYLAIVDEGQEKFAREAILAIVEERFGRVEEAFKSQLDSITDLDRLRRMHRRAIKADSWQEALETP